MTTKLLVKTGADNVSSFLTIEAWIASLPMTLTEPETLQIVDPGIYTGPNTVINWQGRTTSETNFLLITCAPDNRHDGRPFSVSGKGGAINNVIWPGGATSHLRLENVEIIQSNASYPALNMNDPFSANSDVRTEGCIIHGTVAATNFLIINAKSSTLRCVFRNNIIFSPNAIDTRGCIVCIADNNTVTMSASGNIWNCGSATNFTNTYVGFTAGSGSAFYAVGAGSPTGDHNASSDTTATTLFTSSLANIAPSAVFTNVTAGSEDYNLKAGTNALVDAGMTQTSAPVDARGRTRPIGAAYDIGALERVIIGVPGAPTNVVATAGPARATVTFTAPINDGGQPITSYTATWSGGGSASAASSPITITGLTAGVAGSVTVTATNASGAGPASAASNTVTPTAAVTAPTAAVSSIAVDGQNVTVNLTTTGSPSGGTLTLTGSGGGVTQGPANLTFGSNTATVTFPNVPAGTYTETGTVSNAGGSNSVTGPVSFEIQAINGNPVAGQSGAATPDTTAPTMNGTLDFTSITPTSATATWVAASDNVGIGGYEFSSDNGGSYVDIGMALSRNLTALLPNTLYQCKVRSYDPSGNRATPLSNSFTTAVAPDTTAPVMSGTLNATSITPTSFTLSWSAATDNVSVNGYELSMDNALTWSDIGINLVKTVDTLSPDTNYAPQVRAYDPSNNKSNALTTAVKTAQLPISVVVVTSVEVSPTLVSIKEGQQQQFGVQVILSGTNPKNTVTWTCDIGGINNLGLYTPPAATDSPQIALIRATSDDDPTKFAVATVTIAAREIPLPPPDQTRLRSYTGNVRTKYGNAVEKAKVYVFDQETKQPVQLYKDADKVDKANNPVQTDSQGYFEFFVEAAQCGYTVQGFGIDTYTRENIFDIATSVDLNPLQVAVNNLNLEKATRTELANIAAGKASNADLNLLSQQVSSLGQTIQKFVTVNDFVTAGDGSVNSPWTGWDTEIAWTAYTEYQFQDGYYAYTESPNFAKDFLKLRGKRGTIVKHTGTGYALVCDAGSNSEINVGVEITLRLQGNVNSDGGVYMRACLCSTFDITFYEVPNVCFTEYSGVLNHYKLSRSNVFGVQSIVPTCLLESNRRVGSRQSTNNEYKLIAEGCTGYGVALNDTVNSRFNGGTVELNYNGLYISASSTGNTFGNMDLLSNDNIDLMCLGSYNTFVNARSAKEANFLGNSNVITGGQFDRINNGGAANQYQVIAYGINGGLFTDSGTSIYKYCVTNQATGLMDIDSINTVQDLNVAGKTTLSSETLNVGNGQLYKSPTGQFGIGQTTFLNDAPLNVTNPNNTTTAEGFRVTLGTAALTTTAKLAAFNTGGSDVCLILGNGNLQNFSNSYGAISDIRYKENIVPATNKLSQLMNVNVVNYNIIGSEERMLGVISQELEAIFPNMVETIPIMENGVQVGDYKAVKYSIFVPMLIKALQELNAKVDAL